MTNWKLVPVEPAWDMRMAGVGAGIVDWANDVNGAPREVGECTAKIIYEAMIEDVPNPADDAELVERVAKAIAEAAGFETDFDDFADAFELEMEQARAALKAIQEER